MNNFSNLVGNAKDFSKHLYSNMPVTELQYIAKGPADWVDCSDWDITEAEWYTAVATALAARLNDLAAKLSEKAYTLAA